MGVCFHRLRIKVLEVFEAFQQTEYGIFYATTCKPDCLQIPEMAQVPSMQVQVRVQVQVLSCKYKYTGLPLAMQMKLNKIHESWLSYYRSHTHINN